MQYSKHWAIIGKLAIYATNVPEIRTIAAITMKKPTNVSIVHRFLQNTFTYILKCVYPLMYAK